MLYEVITQAAASQPGQFDFDLREKVDDVLGTAIELGMAPLAPARTAVRDEATAQPASLWQWMPTRVPGNCAHTFATVS